MNRPKVVILGGAFGGLAAARVLYKDADVTVIDRHNYQTFLPLLYQVSTAGLAADHVAWATATEMVFTLGIARAARSICQDLLESS